MKQKSFNAQLLLNHETSSYNCFFLHLLTPQQFYITVLIYFIYNFLKQLESVMFLIPGCLDSIYADDEEQHLELVQMTLLISFTLITRFKALFATYIKSNLCVFPIRKSSVRDLVLDFFQGIMTGFRNTVSTI